MRTRKVWSDMSAQLGPPSSSQGAPDEVQPKPRPQELRDQKEGRRFVPQWVLVVRKRQMQTFAATHGLCTIQVSR
jgi:hypothetical protein